MPVARARKPIGVAARSLDQERIKYKGKMKGRVARGVYELDGLIRKARRAGRPGYIVRWRGYTEKDDTFEPNANIPRQWRDEFEEEQRRGREAPPTPKPPKPPKPPRVPRVVELTAHEPEELRRQRVADAPADAYQLQVAAATKLKRLSEPKHELKLCSLEGVTASRFDGLRRWLLLNKWLAQTLAARRPEPRVSRAAQASIDDKQALRAKLRDEVLKGLDEWADEAGG